MPAWFTLIQYEVFWVSRKKTCLPAAIIILPAHLSIKTISTIDHTFRNSLLSFYQTFGYQGTESSLSDDVFLCHANSLMALASMQSNPSPARGKTKKEPSW